MDFILGSIATKEEDVFPKAPMGIHAKETSTQHDEARDVHGRIGCELMKLHTVNKEKPIEKFMGGERKTSVDKGNEKYPGN
jgi:hypothetical protein